MRKILLLLGGLCVIIGVAVVAYRPSRASSNAKKPPAYLIGSYRWGGWWSGGSLHLIEDGTYSSDYHTDVRNPGEEEKREGEPSDEDTFEVEDGRIKLISWKNGEPTTTAVYCIVPWDKRIYLIKDGEFEDFVKAIRSGKEPCLPLRDNDFLVRGKDSDGVPKGLPQFPKERQPMLKGVKRVKPLR